MTYEPWQEKILKIVDSNIEMFSGYKDSHSVKVLERLTTGRALAVECFEGRLDWKDVPWNIKEFAIDMPAWGTYGT